MHTLTYHLKQLAYRYPEGSYATQANRRSMLELCGDQLWEAGYKQMRPEDLKGRHVTALLGRWKADGIKPATIKNRLSVVRWWATKVGRRSILANANAHYGVPPRPYVAKTSKARALPTDKLGSVRNAYVRMSLEMQLAFGLRREESIKIRPWEADHGAALVLRASWTKGGRPREIPIRTAAQREVLERAKTLVKRKTASLIPSHKSYVQQMRSYEWQCRRVGLQKMHGLRHAYAQERFEELAGFPCPACGGPTRDAMTPAQREADEDARVILSAEMGHARTQITTAYLGSSVRREGVAGVSVAPATPEP